jgi:hypothetical protein
MFSPSLTTAIVHAADDHERLPEALASQNIFARLAKEHGSEKRIAVVGQTSKGKGVELGGLKYAHSRDDSGESDSNFFWGTVPVDELVRHGVQAAEIDASEQFLDLAAPFEPTNSGVSNTAVEQRCRQLLARTASIASARCFIGLVDLGVPCSAAGQEDFGGALTHATGGLDFHPHALQVLRTLLEHLEHRGILSSVHIVCSLCALADERDGLRVFEHGSAPQMLTALTHLKSFLLQYERPAAINLSMGSHVGPHNGHSPLEEYVAGRWDPMRILHVSAGNDGLRGIHAVRDLRGGRISNLVLQTGHVGDEFLLTEFWWKDQCGHVELDVDVLDENGVAIFQNPVSVDSRMYQTILAPYGEQDPRLTLVAAKCRADMNCIAFGIRKSSHSNLANLQLRFKLRSDDHAAVHAWIACANDKRTAFIGSTPHSSLRVPATARHAVGVAGAIDNRQGWEESSIGVDREDRACHFYWQDTVAPVLAHRVDCVDGRPGTSYASPRACADTAELLLRGVRPAGVEDLVREFSLGQGGWNPHTGFGIVQL